MINSNLKIGLTIILMMISFIINAQNQKKTISESTRKIDSLMLELNKTKYDTTRIRILNAISDIEYGLVKNAKYDDQIVTLVNNNLALNPQLFIKKIYMGYLANVIHRKGRFNHDQGSYSKALEYYNKSLKIREEINDKKGVASSFNNIGMIYNNQGDISMALDYYSRSLKIREEIRDKQGIANSCRNFSFFYKKQRNYSKALEYINKSLKIYEECNDKSGISYSLCDIGSIYYGQDNIPKALEYYSKSLKIIEELRDKEGTSAVLSYMGSIFVDQGKISKALEYYHKSLKIYEELGYKIDIAHILNRIGLIYNNQGDYAIALEYFNKSLKIFEEIDNKSGISFSSICIGIAYSDQKNYSKALEYYNKSLKIREELGDKYGISGALNNIGLIYADQANKAKSRHDLIGSDSLFKKALVYYNKSLNLKKEIGEKEAISVSLGNIGYIYLYTNQVAKALDCAKEAYSIAKETGYVEHIKEASNLLEKIYAKQGNYKLSRQFFGEYIIMRDSISNKETQNLIQKKYFQYEYEKKAATDSIVHSKAMEIKNLEIGKQKAESRKQKIVIGFIVSGLFLIIVIAIIILRSLRITRKQKIIIETQKQLVDEKNFQLNQQNEEIRIQRDLVTQQKEYIEHVHEEQTDSIRYAERIQRAVLPRDQYIKERINVDFFILFKPRDIVSGDFYFVEKRKNWLLITVADCTGHGVPGAFMSMLGISFLNEIIAKEEVQSAGHVLDELRKYVIQSLQQKGVQGEQQDGMDIAFLALNIETNTIEFSGANNPLYIIPAASNEIITIKADTMPIGIYGDMQPFKNNTIQVNKGDSLYIFSDGFIDQFGGENHKKFLSKRFKESLLKICQLPMPEQKDKLNIIFENWKGKGEQIDDVTILGIKI